jgi:hypothetical protein
MESILLFLVRAGVPADVVPPMACYTCQIWPGPWSWTVWLLDQSAGIPRLFEVSLLFWKLFCMVICLLRLWLHQFTAFHFYDTIHTPLLWYYPHSVSLSCLGCWSKCTSSVVSYCSSILYWFIHSFLPVFLCSHSYWFHWYWANFSIANVGSKMLLGPFKSSSACCVCQMFKSFFTISLRMHGDSSLRVLVLLFKVPNGLI